VSTGGEGGVPSKLPAATAWVNDATQQGAQLVLIKQVHNGAVTFFTNPAFDSYVVTREFLQSTWTARGRPSTELFLHPEDAPVICGFVGRLWKGLAPSQQDAGAAPDLHPGGLPGSGGGSGTPGAAPGTEKTCMRSVPSPVRVWISSPRPGYVQCNVRVQLVVHKSSSGQTSHIVFSFTKAQQAIAQPEVPMPRQPAATAPTCGGAAFKGPQSAGGEPPPKSEDTEPPLYASGQPERPSASASSSGARAGAAHQPPGGGPRSGGACAVPLVENPPPADGRLLNEDDSFWDQVIGLADSDPSYVFEV